MKLDAENCSTGSCRNANKKKHLASNERCVLLDSRKILESKEFTLQLLALVRSKAVGILANDQLARRVGTCSSTRATNWAILDFHPRISTKIAT
jgi:hypothetical protein